MFVCSWLFNVILSFIWFFVNFLNISHYQWPGNLLCAQFDVFYGNFIYGHRTRYEIKYVHVMYVTFWSLFFASFTFL